MLRILARRTAWAVGDQAVSSLSNFLFSILVARTASARGFGSFSASLVVVMLALGVVRATIGEAFVISPSSPPRAGGQPRLTDPVGAALGIGLLFLVFFAAAAPAFGEDAWLALSVAVWIPVVVGQDTLRYLFIGRNRYRDAFQADSIWLVGFLLLAAGGAMLGFDGPMRPVVAWGVGALLSLGWSWRRLDMLGLPRPTRLLDWIRDRWHHVGGLWLEYLSFRGIQNVVMLLFAGIVGLQALGSLRAAHVLFGPAVLLFAAGESFGVAEVRRRRQEGASLRADALGLSMALTGATLVYGLVVFALPPELGRELLGDSWAGASGLLDVVMAHKLVVALGIGAVVGLRVLGRTTLSGAARAVGGGGVLLFGLAGAWWSGVRAGAIGIAAGLLVSSVALWIIFSVTWKDDRQDLSSVVSTE